VKSHEKSRKARPEGSDLAPKFDSGADSSRCGLIPETSEAPVRLRARPGWFYFWAVIDQAKHHLRDRSGGERSGQLGRAAVTRKPRRRAASPGVRQPHDAISRAPLGAHVAEDDDIWGPAIGEEVRGPSILVRALRT
jgi:hypothetical protein